MNPIVNITLLWLIAGSALCLTELFLPTSFVAFMMGISALLVAAVSLLVPQFTLQVAIWLLLSTSLIILSRRFFTPKRRRPYLGDDDEGETLTAIPAGETGRVLYEGNSWRAKCEDQCQPIPANQRVYVLRKEGNTLVVLPHNLLNGT